MKLKLLVTSCWLLLCLIAYAGHSHTEICFGAGSHQLYPMHKKQVRPLQHFSGHKERRQNEGPDLARQSVNRSPVAPVNNYMSEP
ncbi:hypothetical protein [Chitinophaga eiseniae]|uniref:hypothetical protein n=1 Tax=Chitinophaga eiseniae TaxID=634771 RepID=UPI0011786DA0|nr:hypothetical protein [Chitinophaga eiseniae]